MLNSLGYIREALRLFIADSLRIYITEAELPVTKRRDFDEVELIHQIMAVL